MKKIKWGILATGNIANSFANAMKVVDNAELFAVASRSLDKAEQFAQKHGAAKFYGSYEELAKDSEVDVIYIATPMHSHYQDMLLCLNNNKHVLCEKTVTLNASQFEECILLAREKKLFLMEAMWMKFHPLFNRVREWINDGKIGNIKLISAEFLTLPEYDVNGRMFNNELGGGAMLDLGVYPLSFATSFLGFDIKKINTNANIGETNVDENSNFDLIYDNAYARLSCGFNIESQSPAFIIGDKARIRVDNWFFHAQRAWLIDKNHNVIEEVYLPFDENGYEYEIRHVNDCIKKGLIQSDIVPVKDTLKIMKIMDFCRKEWGLTYKGE